MALDYPDFGGVSGLSAAMATLTAAINALQAGYGASTAGWAIGRGSPFLGTTTTIVNAPGVGHELTLMGCALLWLSPGRTKRGWVEPRVLPTGGNNHYAVALTPENPSAIALFPPGTLRMGANTGIDLYLGSYYSAPTADQVAAYLYYTST